MVNKSNILLQLFVNLWIESFNSNLYSYADADGGVGGWLLTNIKHIMNDTIDTPNWM